MALPAATWLIVAPPDTTKKCGKLWRNVALTKLNCLPSGGTFYKKKKMRHITPHFVTVRYVAKNYHLWRYVAIRVDLKKATHVFKNGHFSPQNRECRNVEHYFF